MIIRKMRASFGALENETLELKPGLNIISAPNESGKSTWCAFIRSMLYGIDSAQREKGGIKPDKVKYAPWTGAAMSGEMDIEHEGKSITLRRSTKTASAPMREFSAVYTGSEDAVPGFRGTDVGEKLTGMPKSVFESSVFVRQAGLAVGNSPELEKRINAIISTGEDEAVSYTDADELLRAWLRKRRHNRSGAIPALDSQIMDMQRSMDASASAVEERSALEQQLQRSLEDEENAATASKEQGEVRRKGRIAALEKLRDALSEAEKRHAEALSRAEALKAAAGTGPFAGKDGAEARRVAGVDANRLENFALIPSWLNCIIPLIAAAITIAVGLSIDKLFFVAIIGYVLVFVTFISFMVIRTKKKDLKTFSDNIAKWYELDEASPEAILEKAEDYVRNLEKAEAAQAECEALSDELSKNREALRAAEEDLLSAAEESNENPLLERAKAESAALKQLLSRKEGELAAMGDPMVMATELESLQSRRAELMEQYDALSLAISTLREANDEMQQRFSPALGRRAGEIMSVLTEGKYSGLSFSRELDATARREGDTVAHEKAFLSQGTADQLYLALRLAICELALPEGYSCPIILDDALVNFDDERMAQAMELLSALAEERQIILFSCHDREKKWLENK